jgi:dimethylhistidine N-methyltransferase
MLLAWTAGSATSAAMQPNAFDPGEALQAVLVGLSRPQKALPGKYLWDETGSLLFERICATEDYYLTRNEMALLNRKVDEIARLVGPAATIVEFGSGASHKVRLLLDRLTWPRRYVAVDISSEFLDQATSRVARDYPEIEVIPVVADYTKPMNIPTGTLIGNVVGFFPGSTIGNFDPDGVVAFLRRVRGSLRPSWFVVGADATRDEARLLRAYGEADGLMAALHKNLLVHLNRLTGTTFDPADFRHEARVLAHPPRVEAHLVARRPLHYEVAGRTFTLNPGESIHTDNAYKHDVETFRTLAAEAGWTLVRCWLDPAGSMSLHVLRP